MLLVALQMAMGAPCPHDALEDAFPAGPDGVPPQHFEAWATSPPRDGSHLPVAVRATGAHPPVPQAKTWRWHQWPYVIEEVDGKEKKLRTSRSRFERPLFAWGTIGALAAVSLHSVAAYQRSRGQQPTALNATAWTVTGASSLALGTSLGLAVTPKVAVRRR